MSRSASPEIRNQRDDQEWLLVRNGLGGLGGSGPRGLFIVCVTASHDLKDPLQRDSGGFGDLAQALLNPLSRFAGDFWWERS
jgi:hypothetical protein